MKRETHPIDDLFREVLNDHPVAPSDASRSRFLEEASVGGIIKGTPRWPWLNIFLVAGFIGVAVILYFLFSHNQGTTPGVTPQEATTSAQTSVSSKNSALSNNPNITTDNITTSISKIKTSSDQSKVPQTTEIAKSGKSDRQNNSITQTSQKPRLEVVDSPVQPVNSEISERKTDKLIVSHSSNAEQETKMVLSPQETNPVSTELLPSQTREISGETPSSGDVNSTGQSGNSPEDKPEGSGSPGSPKSPGPPDPKSKKPVFTPYLRYNIEKSFNDDNLVHTLGVEGRLKYGRFYLQSGASFLVRNGEKHNRVQLNEYLGNYKKLDSITFNWDQKQYHLLPTYHMSETDVFDSALKIDEYLIFKQYRKVRIPLMLGYEVLQKGRFTLAVQSGVEWDLYLGSDEKSGSYDAGLNKVVNIDYLPDPLARNLVYWKSDISIGCRITKRMILLAEPHIKYLLNPLESSSGEELKIWNPMLKGSLIIEF
jgi:hypothetical protein